MGKGRKKCAAKNKIRKKIYFFLKSKLAQGEAIGRKERGLAHVDPQLVLGCCRDAAAVEGLPRPWHAAGERLPAGPREHKAPGGKAKQAPFPPGRRQIRATRLRTNWGLLSQHTPLAAHQPQDNGGRLPAEGPPPAPPTAAFVESKMGGKNAPRSPPRPSPGPWKAGSLFGACRSLLCRVVPWVSWLPKPSPAGSGQRLAGVS